jgi:hypothetical protein
MSETEPEELNINRMNNSIGKNTEIETNDEVAAAKAPAEIPAPPAAPTPAETPGPAADAGPGPGPGPAEAEAKTETAEAKTETAEAKTETAEAKTETAEAKTETPGPAAKATPGPAAKHDNGRNHRSDENAEQDKMNKEAAAAAAEEKKKIVDKIKKLELDIILKGKELDQKYIAAKGDDKTQEGLEVDMEAFSTETNEEIDKLYEQLNDTDEEPLIIKLFSGAWNLIESKFQVIFKKMMLKPKVAEAQLEMLDIISKNIKDIKDNGGSLDVEYAQNLENLILSLSKDVSQTPGKSESSKTPDTPGAGMMDKIKSTFNKLKTPGTAVVADPAVAGLDPKAAAVAGLDPAAAAPAPEAPAPEAAVAAVAAGGGQGGGGISRKRSHPKYINQISENRNKIFKKELEIINSIRHFHRSHTIRKRDKINSILGLRKSKNNKRSSNTKNTRRHRHEHQHKHRHNNHKHKSAKHVKK